MAIVEDDIAIAVEIKFAADAQLPTLIPGGLHRGRLTANPSMPYATLEIAADDRSEEFQTGGHKLAHRTVSIMIRGTESDVRSARSQVQAVFDPVRDGSNVLDIPNSQFFACWPLERHLEEDPATKSGKDIWIGTVKYRVSCMRIWQD